MKFSGIYEKDRTGMSLVVLIFDADGKRALLDVDDLKFFVPVHRKLERMSYIMDVALVKRIFFCAVFSVFF